MVLYGWWYLIGVAAIVVFWAIFMAPAERRHFKRRLDLIQKRIRRKERKERKKREAQKKIEIERRTRSGRRWNRFKPPPRK